jgi:hypothetical protein
MPGQQAQHFAARVSARSCNRHRVSHGSRLAGGICLHDLVGDEFTDENGRIERSA